MLPGSVLSRFHNLRHTVATILLQENVHSKVVQELPGHSTITTTLDTYSHVGEPLQKEAADKSDTILLPSGAYGIELSELVAISET